MKIKNLCSAKEIIKRIKRQVTNWEEIFVKYIFDKGLLYKKTQITFKQIAQLKNEPKTLTDTSAKKIYKLKLCICVWKDTPHHRSSRKCKFKDKEIPPHTTRIAEVQNTDNPKTWTECAAMKLSFIASRNAKWHSCLGRHRHFLTKLNIL